MTWIYRAGSIIRERSDGGDLHDATFITHLVEKFELGRVRRLDLGSGPEPRSGYTGLDVCHSSSGTPTPGVPWNLASGWPWPFADGSIEALYSSHFIEHLPATEVAVFEFATWARLPADGMTHSVVPSVQLRSLGQRDLLGWFMDEAYRVAQPGARFELRWPAPIDPVTGGISLSAFIDPTHRRFIPLEQLLYFSRSGRRALGVEQYPFQCDWSVIEQGYRSLGGALGYEYIALLEKRLTA